MLETAFALLVHLAFLRPAAERRQRMIYIGGRPGEIFILDEATEKVAGGSMTKTGCATT